MQCQEPRSGLLDRRRSGLLDTRGSPERHTEDRPQRSPVDNGPRPGRGNLNIVRESDSVLGAAFCLLDRSRCLLHDELRQLCQALPKKAYPHAEAMGSSSSPAVTHRRGRLIARGGWQPRRQRSRWSETRRSGPLSQGSARRELLCVRSSELLLRGVEGELLEQWFVDAVLPAPT